MFPEPLPVKRFHPWLFFLFLAAALLMAALSMTGVFNVGNLYSTPEMRETYLANDLVNLLIGLPLLIGAVVMTRRGRLVGLLLWPGALLFIVYNYIAYLVGMPLSWISILYLALVLLCVLQIALLMAAMDHVLVKGKLSGHIPRKLTAGVLVFFGAAFLLLAVSEILQASRGAQGLTAPDLGVRAADSVVSMLWITGGIMLFRKSPPGYSSAAGLLFAASALFVGLILFLLLRPFLIGVPFDPGEFLVILVMSLMSFVPFGLLMRGIWKVGSGV